MENRIREGLTGQAGFHRVPFLPAPGRRDPRIKVSCPCRRPAARASINRRIHLCMTRFIFMTICITNIMPFCLKKTAKGVSGSTTSRVGWGVDADGDPLCDGGLDAVAVFQPAELFGDSAVSVPAGKRVIALRTSTGSHTGRYGPNSHGWSPIHFFPCPAGKRWPTG